MTKLGRVKILARGRAPSSVRVAALALGSLLALALGSGTAIAGQRLTANVTVDLFARTARGSVANARSATGDTYIGCWSRQEIDPANPDSVTNHAGCSAKRGLTEISCEVIPGAEQSFAWAMSLMGPSSYLEFTWDSSRRCRTLRVYNDSRYAPKRP